MSGTKSRREELKLPRGRLLWVEVTETPTDVFLFIGGDQIEPADAGRFQRFFWPIIHQFESDSRPWQIEGEHAPDWGGRIYTLGGGFIAFERLPCRRMHA